MHKKLKNTLSSLAFVAGTLTTPVLLAAGVPGDVLGEACAGCHGTNGLSLSPMPRIAGINKDYLTKTMKNYQMGERTSTIMERLAKGYTEEEFAAIGEFFGGKTWESPVQEVDAKLVAQGEKLHKEKGCETCHKENGKFTDGKTPRVAGQWSRYLEIVMEEYGDPDRKMPDQMMKSLFKMLKLSADDLKALAHFYASQK